MCKIKTRKNTHGHPFGHSVSNVERGKCLRLPVFPLYQSDEKQSANVSQAGISITDSVQYRWVLEAKCETLPFAGTLAKTTPSVHDSKQKS